MSRNILQENSTAYKELCLTAITLTSLILHTPT